MNKVHNPNDATLTMGDFAHILWGGKWILLVSVVAGVGWALLNFPPGAITARSDVKIEAFRRPTVMSFDDIPWWPLVLQTAGLKATGWNQPAFSETITQSDEAVSIVLIGPDSSLEAQKEIITQLENSLKPASEAYIHLVEQRLDVLRTIRINPGAETQLLEETLNLELFLGTAKARPGGLFKLNERSYSVSAIGLPGAYIRSVLIALAAGIAATIGLHLLSELWRGRRSIARQ